MVIRPVTVGLLAMPGAASKVTPGAPETGVLAVVPRVPALLITTPPPVALAFQNTARPPGLAKVPPRSTVMTSVPPMLSGVVRVTPLPTVTLAAKAGPARSTETATDASRTL